MKIYVQWSQVTPRDWELIDSAEWPNITKGPVPCGGEVLTEEKLWVHSVNVQGVEFHSFDHYAFYENKVFAWCDDPDGWLGDYWGQVWTFNDPCPDPKIGGRINTKQSFIIYAETVKRRKQVRAQNIDIIEDVKTFDEFPYIDEEYVGHGIFVEDSLNEEHLACRSTHGWREWIND